MALDPSYAFYSEGTITLTNGSDIATGEFVAWDPAVLPFDFVVPNNGTNGLSVVEEVLAMDQIRLAAPWSGPTLTDVPYFMVRWTKHTDPQVYALRLSDYLTRVKAIPENIEEIGEQVATDAAAVASALSTITQAASDVEADRQAVETAADAVETAQITTLDARDVAVAARDVAVSAAGSTQALWDTRAAAMAANIPAPVQYLRTAGYATVGDGGGALYKRISAPGASKPWHFQSTDGAWWQLAEAAVTPEHLGAKGDGVADDTAALNNALLFSRRVVAARTYKTSAAITLGAAGVANILDGQGTGRIICSVNNVTVVVLTGGLAGYRVTGLSIERSVTAVAGGDGLSVLTGGAIGTTNQSYLSRLTIKGHYVGITLGATDYSELTDSTIESNYSHGVYMTNSASYGAAQWHLRNVLAQLNSGTGFRYVSTNGPAGAILGEWVGLKTFANGGGAIKVIGTATTPVNDLRILGGFIGADNGDEIYLDTFGANHLIQNMFIEYSGASACGPGFSIPASNTGYGIAISINNKVVGLTGNKIYLCAHHGIYSRGTNVVINGNIVNSCGRTLEASLRVGIYIDGGNAVVTGNRSGNLEGGSQQQWGMVSSLDAICVTGNDFNNNVSGPMFSPPLTNSVVTGNVPRSMNVA
jgi:hypothetical protein